MTNPHHTGNRLVWIAIAVVLVSRIPFLFHGYGSEEDAWGLILTARNISLTGMYEVSRMPGHPIQELLLSQLWSLPSWILNLLTMLVSTSGVLFFMLTLKHLKVESYIAAGMAIAFTPIFYINSTNVMDYTWALSLTMLALYLLVTEKLVLAGVVLGLAVGFRITAAAMGIVFAVYLFFGERPLLKILILGSAAIITALASFLPAFQVYGTSFFTYYEYFPYPPMLKNIYKATFGAWGPLGLLAIAYGTYHLIKKFSAGRLHQNPLFLMSVAAVILYTWSFLKIPQKSAFVIPMIPFILLAFSTVMTGKQMSRIALMLFLSSFFFGVNLDDPIRGSAASPLAIKTSIGQTGVTFDPLVGMVTADQFKRKRKMEYASDIAEQLKLVQTKTALIAGWWQNEINYFLLNRKPETIQLLYYADAKTLNQLSSSGYQIYYLPEQDYYNDLRFGGESFTGSIAKAYHEHSNR